MEAREPTSLARTGIVGGKIGSRLARPSTRGALLLISLLLTVSGGLASAFDWRISSMATHQEGSLCNCVARPEPFAYQSVLIASKGDIFRLTFSCEEQASEVLVAITTKSLIDELAPQPFVNQSLQVLRDRIRASAKAWAEGHSGTFEWSVDTPGRYGWIVVPYRALGQLGFWEISFKIVIEQISPNLPVRYTAYATAALGIAILILALLLPRARERQLLSGKSRNI